MSLKQESKLIQANITDVQSGKSSAYEQLYRVHAGRVYTFGLKMYGRNKQAARELTKRVFTKGFEQINDFQENITFILWLKKFAVEEIRKGDIKKSEDANKLSPADEAIFSLPVEERIIFILNDIDKMGKEEIYEVTQDSEEVINERLESARKRLMNIFEVDNLDDVDHKINFVTFKTEPDDDLWDVLYKEIRSIATKDLEEETSGDILNVGDARISLSEKIEKLKEEKAKRRKEISSPWKVFFVILILILIAAAVWYFGMFSKTGWEVTNLSGSPSINSPDGYSVVIHSAMLESGETLETDNNSKAVIKIPRVTKIYLTPGSSIRYGGDAGEVTLVTGEINVVKSIDSESFPVEVLSARVEDYKAGSYSVSIEKNNAEVESETAGLIITSDNSKVYLIPGYECNIGKNGEIEIPVSPSASKEFISALNNFIDDRGRGNLNSILLLSEKKDVLTLLNLLPLVVKSSRGIVINKMHGFVNMPEDADPDGVSDLKEEYIIKWLNQIEKEELN